MTMVSAVCNAQRRGAQHDQSGMHLPRSATLRVMTGRSASHERHTRPVSAEAGLLRPTRAYGPVCPNKRLAGYFGRLQHGLLSRTRVAGGYL
jgi:hypothetical protein